MMAQARVNSRDEIGTLASTFNNMARQLRELLGSLEQRVADRTHDLELAHEVGRAVTEKVDDLSMMLNEAVETIRFKFDLYYTQVYLADPSGHNLMLRAGTGDAGAQLLSRGHRLAISSASLNGRAASDRAPVLVGDTQKSANFLPNPLLPDTRSELAVPLIASGKVVGVLDMQSTKVGTFSDANIPAFQVLAGQLAIAIQNAALFEKVEQSRQEVEEQAQRLTISGWQDFLNAIDRNEQIGFTFHENEFVPAAETQASSLENVLVIPIEITGAHVGEIRLADEHDRQWTNAEKEVVMSTAARVAQHIENLRLLAQAEQYRFEAEQVSRQLTREGWNRVLENRNQTGAFAYDLNEVRPLTENENNTSKNVLKQTLAIRDETIGELAVEANTNPEEVKEILEAVAQQLSGHIESLRLSELNQRHAQREQTLRQITSALRSSTNPETIMRTAVREIGSILGRRTIVQMTNPKQDSQAKSNAANGNSSNSAVDPDASA
jgi:GAF domain-containing protein